MIKLVPTYFDVLSESLFSTPSNMLLNYVGKRYMFLLPFISTIFYLILFSNLLGLLPYSSTPTVELVLTLAFAVTFLFGVLFLGILNHRQHILAVFLPSGVPVALLPLMVMLEMMSYLTRTFSLGLRLGVNLITGHILAKVCVSFIYLGFEKNLGLLNLILPIFTLSLFLSLEVLIAYLQAYIFTFIGCLTIKDLDI